MRGRYRITRTNINTGKTETISTIYWTLECAERAVVEYEEEHPQYKCEVVLDDIFSCLKK